MTSKHTDIIFVICFICETIMFIALGVIYYNDVIKNVVDNSSPVEGMVKVDSISEDNNKLIIEVNNLDSIKDAKTIEIESLDNDSTLKLFYQLIGK